MPDGMYRLSKLIAFPTGYYWRHCEHGRDKLVVIKDGYQESEA
ncbi:MAG: hypothetical protein ACTS73_04765 [Arsenophonus sp. NEOnobi-MAG3]